jgi:hypothetical protein
MEWITPLELQRTPKSTLFQSWRWLVFWGVAPCNLIDHPDDGGSKHLWNVSQFLPDYRRNIPEDSHLIFVPVRTWNLTLQSRSHTEIGSPSEANIWVGRFLQLQLLLGTRAFSFPAAQQFYYLRCRCFHMIDVCEGVISVSLEQLWVWQGDYVETWWEKCGVAK